MGVSWLPRRTVRPAARQPLHPRAVLWTDGSLWRRRQGPNIDLLPCTLCYIETFWWSSVHIKLTFWNPTVIYSGVSGEIICSVICGHSIISDHLWSWLLIQALWFCSSSWTMLDEKSLGRLLGCTCNVKEVSNSREGVVISRWICIPGMSMAWHGICQMRHHYYWYDW